MGLPLSFLAGLTILLLHDELDSPLPGAASGIDAPLWLLLLVPWLLARINACRLLRRGAAAAPTRGLIRALRLQQLAVPLVYAVLVFDAGLGSIRIPSSITLQFLCMIGPLLFMEVSMRLAERHILRALQGSILPTFLGPQRLAMTMLVFVPILLTTLAMDLVFRDRGLEVFFRATSLGNLLGFLVLVGAFCVLLPQVFRVVLPTSARLPAHLEKDLRQTAARLGFRGQDLLVLRTGHRVVNAAMVGPLPWPRFLILTDGLLSLLDPFALRGVVAHEVAHARARHPALMVGVFLGLPLLSLQPISMLGAFEMGTKDQILFGGIALVLLWFGLRGLAHRFELEADQLAAEALGGAEACIRALRMVGQLAPQAVHRASFRHPSERQRIANLLRLADDSDHRAAFHRRGRGLRWALCFALLVALGANVWTQVLLWPADHALYLHYMGRFPQARRQLDRVSNPPPHGQEQLVAELTEEVAVGLILEPKGGDWEKIRDRLADRAWERGQRVFGERGPGAAMAWFALASSKEVEDPLRASMYRYCRAVGDEDRETSLRLREHILRRFRLSKELRAGLR